MRCEVSAGVVQVAQEEELEYIASCQLHRSWISDAEMLPPLLSESCAKSADASTNGPAGGMPWVISASNGGEIALWNPAAVDAHGRFSLVAEAQNVHSKGIFSMHVCPQSLAQGGAGSTAGIEVLSCSKDCSVALTAVNSTGIEVVRAWEGVHAGVAKAVRWRDSQLAASAGNDRSVELDLTPSNRHRTSACCALVGQCCCTLRLLQRVAHRAAWVERIRGGAPAEQRVVYVQGCSAIGPTNQGTHGQHQ